MHFKITAVNGMWYWRLLRDNGETLAQAPTICTNKEQAEDTIKLIKQWAAAAEIKTETEQKSVK